MNSIFGVGMAELVLILLLAGLLLGPQHIRQIARKLGFLAANAQKIIAQLRVQLNSELDAVDMQEMRAAVEDIQTLQKQMTDMRREMQNMLATNSASLETAVRNKTTVPNIPPAPEEDEMAERSIAPDRPHLPRAVPIADDPEV